MAFLKKNMKSLAFIEFSHYFCIGCRYNDHRYKIKNMGENTNNALTEAVYYILLSLVTPLHGYGIMQRTSELSKGRLTISAGTLYGAINTLLERGWIKQLFTAEESRRKQYLITEEGMSVLTTELNRLTELVYNGQMILNNSK